MYYYYSSLGQILFYETTYNVIILHRSMQSTMLSNFCSELIVQCCMLATVELANISWAIYP